MNIYLCHTPLHLLLAALELPEHMQTRNFLFVVEDVPGIHELASALFSSPRVELSMLPGTASNISRTSSVIDIQKRNAVTIKKVVSNTDIDQIFIFFDQRAEAQAILNHPLGKRTLVTWLEDGITTYSVASPFPHPLRRLIKHKIRFDLRWKGSKWLGEHPRIDQIRCFFPDLLRCNLRKMKADALSRSLEDSYLSGFLRFYGMPKYDRKTGIIVLPHPDCGLSRSGFDHFVSESVKFFRSIDAVPVIKRHPRDASPSQSLDQLPPCIKVMQQNLPVELVLFAEKNIEAITGCRTSTLHVASAIHPFIQARYYEPRELSSRKSSEDWGDFFEKVAVPSLIKREH